MKLIKPCYEILSDTDDIFKNIEIAGRTCYKSEDKITKDSSEKFVKMLSNRGHTAMLEHGTIYLLMNNFDEAERYFYNTYSRIIQNKDDLLITTNYRVLVENGWLDDLQYQCKPTEHHEKRISVKFVCDRGISHELVRHRVFSFAQESTRYCNYSKDKFDNQLTFIIPPWIQSIEEGEGKFELYKYNNEDYFGEQIVFSPDTEWLSVLQEAETNYSFLLGQNWTPQEARSILPNSLKTEIVVTGFASDWKGFYDEEMKPHGMFPLRVDKAAHPQMRELMCPLLDILKEKIPVIFEDITYEM